MMSTAHEHLTADQERLEREYAASYAAQRRRAADPEFMAFLRYRLKELDRVSAKPKTTEEFFAQTEHLRP
jgi:hypothetical protein